MTDVVPEDFSVELARRLRDDVDVLHKDRSLVDRCVLACAEDGLVWSQVLAVFRQFKIVRQWEPRIKRSARELGGVPTIGEPSLECMPVRQVWPDAPVHSEASAPVGWGYGDKRAAVYEIVEKNVDGAVIQKRLRVAYQPIVISRKLMHTDRNDVLIELAWRNDDGWQQRVFERDVVASSQLITKAAIKDLPVRSDNALDVVKYLGAYEYHNRNLIPVGYASSGMGWKGSASNPTAHGFLFGHRQLGGNGKSFEFHALGDGDQVDADRLSSGGTLEGWKKSIDLVSNWPSFRIGIYAVLAPPLLAILGCDNAVIEWVFRTSTGKSRLLQVLQSCWRSSAVKLDGWNNTLNNFESKAATMNDLPLFLDDTKRVYQEHGPRAQEMIRNAIYQFVAGSGRGRDSRLGGQRVTRTWRSIMFSTGEVPSSDLASSEGAAARVLSFWRHPTGENSKEVGLLLDRLVHRLLQEDYGHAGPAVVMWLHQNRERWSLLRDAFDEATGKIRQKYDTPAASRLAQVVALLEVSAAVAHAADVIPWAPKSLLDDEEINEILGQSIDQASAAADQAHQAWELVISYAESRASQWISWAREPSATGEPNQGWLGWRGRYMYAWHQDKLRRALVELGFVPDAVLRAWRDLGILVADNNRYTAAIRCGSPEENDTRPGRRRLAGVRLRPDPAEKTCSATLAKWSSEAGLVDD